LADALMRDAQQFTDVTQGDTGTLEFACREPILLGGFRLRVCSRRAQRCACSETVAGISITTDSSKVSACSSVINSMSSVAIETP